VQQLDYSKSPAIFTYRSRTGFLEDRLFRHIEAPHAFHLELPRLSNFNIVLQDGVQTASGNVHLYKATPKNGKSVRRYFARLVSFTADIHSTDVESLFVEALDHLALVMGKEEAEDKNFRTNNTAANHIFINVVSPDTVIQPEYYDNLLRSINVKYWYKMVRLAVTVVELKLTCRLTVDTEPLFLRLVASNPTGFVLNIDKYFEALESNGRTIFKSILQNKSGEWDGLETKTPYETTQKFEIQRAEAMASSETLYAYDWPVLFQSATEKLWSEYLQQQQQQTNHSSTSSSTNNLSSSTTTASSLSALIPTEVFSCQELVICDINTHLPLQKGWTAADAEANGVLLPLDGREAGLNDVGMVAWLLTIFTPEYPSGRQLVVISNDITFQAGSFGTKEDILFFKVFLFFFKIMLYSCF
jgi:hypothetical protein